MKQWKKCWMTRPRRADHHHLRLFFHLAPTLVSLSLSNTPTTLEHVLPNYWDFNCKHWDSEITETTDPGRSSFSNIKWIFDDHFSLLSWQSTFDIRRKHQLHCQNTATNICKQDLSDLCNPSSDLTSQEVSWKREILWILNWKFLFTRLDQNKHDRQLLNLHIHLYHGYHEYRGQNRN